MTSSVRERRRHPEREIERQTLSTLLESARRLYAESPTVATYWLVRLHEKALETANERT